MIISTTGLPSWATAQHVGQQHAQRGRLCHMQSPTGVACYHEFEEKLLLEAGGAFPLVENVSRRALGRVCFEPDIVAVQVVFHKTLLFHQFPKLVLVGGMVHHRHTLNIKSSHHAT